MSTPTDRLEPMLCRCAEALGRCKGRFPLATREAKRELAAAAGHGLPLGGDS